MARSNFEPLDARVIRVRLRFPAPACNFWDTPSIPTYATTCPWQMDQAPFNQEGGNGRAALKMPTCRFLAYSMGDGPGRPQQQVWFNRALISSVATSTFADNMIVQRICSPPTFRAVEISGSTS